MLRLLLFGVLSLAFFAPSAQAASIADEWDKAVPPPAPSLSPVSVDPARTALLVLDIEELTCNAARRPRCLETVPAIAGLLARARAAKMAVVHSQTPKGTPETILPPVKPLPGEPVVRSSVDKFWNTDLENILREKGVDTVIVTGTAAHGAVLHTATAAGFRGFTVILPLDCLSAEDLYTEQASVALLLTGPATRGKITATKSEMIKMP
ncbi:MAG: cysteine hydrolase [Thermodesulfobacteriota bacterium]